MAYIGRDTDKISNVEVLDNITFDGSSSYTLQKGGSNFTPSSANNILISIDGVVQAGNFTVSGSTIDFGTAVAGTSTCDFILHYGIGLITAPSDGTVTEAKIGTNAVTPAKLGYDYNQYRNIIINGDMSIAQRGTSTSSITSDNTFPSCDRWKFRIGTLGTWTVSQDTDVPSGQGFAKSLKVDCTTADASPSASDYLFVSQRIEGQNLQYLKKGTANAESLTASFWVKSNKTGTFIAELYDSDNTRQISKSYTVNSANTWEKKTITYDGDTTGTFDNDNAISLSLNFWLSAGSNYTSGTLNTSWNSSTNANRVVGQVNLADSTDNEWYITGVQLEAGTTASDFEFLPYDVNLGRCQRYYVNNIQIGGAGYATSSGQNARARTTVIFPTTMRATPSTSVANYNGGNVQNTVAFDSTNTIGTMASGESAASGSIYWDADLTIDAEL
jgi:hypothetical protein